MKKFLVCILVTVILISVIDIEPVHAGGAGISIVGPGSITSGQTVPFTINVSISGCTSASISVGGNAYLAGGTSFNWNSPNFGENGSANVSGSVRFTGINENSSGRVYYGVVNVVVSYSYKDSNGMTFSGYSNQSLRIPVNAKILQPPLTPTPAPAPGGTSNPGSPGSNPGSKPGANATPNPTPRPTATPLPNPSAPRDWDQAEFVINNSDDDEISFKMRKKKSEISDIVLNLLKDQEKKLTVDFGDYTCTLDGNQMDAIPDDMDELDLGFSTKINNTIADLSNDFDLMQLHFDDVGTLPCPITYSMPLNLDPGKKVYVYHFEEKSERLQAIQRAIVDGDGNIDFTLYHFSSYVITDRIILEAGGYEEFLKTPTPTPSPVPTPSPTPSPTPRPTASPSPTPRPTQTIVKVTPEGGTPTIIPSATIERSNPMGKMSTWAYILLFAALFVTIGVIITAILLSQKKD